MSSCNGNIEHKVIGCDAGTGTDRTSRVILIHASMIHHLATVCDGTDADVIIMVNDEPDTSHQQWPVFDYNALPVIEYSKVYFEKDELIFHDYVNKFEHVFEHVFDSFSEHGRVRIRSPG